MEPNENYNEIYDVVKQAIYELDAEKNIQFGKELPVDRSFEITHKAEMAKMHEATNTPAGKVQAYIIRQTKLDRCLFEHSISETSQEIGVCKTTVSQVFRNNQKSDLMRYYKDGVWAVNPRLLRRGTGGKFIMLLKFYYSLPTTRDDARRLKKGARKTALISEDCSASQ